MRLVIGLVCLLLAGCGSGGSGGGSGNDQPAGSPSASALDRSAAPGEPLPSVIDSSADNPPGSIACARLAAAAAAGSFMTPGVIDEIVAATATADAPLADAAHRLGEAYRAAVASKNKADEPDKIAAIGEVASDMSAVCAEGGLQTVG